MANKLLIIGASGHGKVAADTAMQMKAWNSISFIDDDASIDTSLGMEVIGSLLEIERYVGEADFFVAIGNNEVREKVHGFLKNKGASVVTLVHPRATIGSDVLLGEGTIIMAGAVINASVRVGACCIINTSSSVDHDCVLENYVHVSPGSRVAGSVRVGKGAWLGIGSSVCNNLSIAERVTVGAGGVVVNDLEEPGLYLGVPARRVTEERCANLDT